MRRPILNLMFLLGASAATAGDAPPKPLPSLALETQPELSPWHGLSIGTDVFAVSGGKGTKGFLGGSVTAGYDRLLPNNVLLGLSVSTGIAPGLSAFGPLQAYDFAAAGLKLGYPIGRWTPYMTTDVVLAKPQSRFGGTFSGMDTANDLFNSTERVDAGARVGAGFDYALTNDVSVGLGVSVQKGAAAVFP